MSVRRKGVSMLSKGSALLCIAVFAFVFVLTANAAAKNRPVQLGLVPPIQIFPEADQISGLRINLIYGKNASANGLDIGLANHTTGVSKGLQWGVVGLADAGYSGGQFNWINVVKSNFDGYQSGIIGLVDSDFKGGQLNCGANITKGNCEGVQFGIVNYTKSMNGLQFGLVNYTEETQGCLQIGVLNIIKKGGQFPAFLILNWAP